MKQIPLSIKAQLDATHWVEFADQEDMFVFIACTGGFTSLADPYEEVTGKKLDTKQFYFYKAKQQRFREIITTKLLTDGKTLLLDYMKGKATQ